MSKKQIICALVFLLVVAAGYVYMYQDLFRKPGIQIFHTFRPRAAALRRPGNTPNAPLPNDIIFGTTLEQKLTAVKVISLDELKTNKYPHPLWELVSDSNSVPTKTFIYGNKIQGLRPVVSNAKPDPLLDNVHYRLILQAGKLKGEHDFIIAETNRTLQ